MQELNRFICKKKSLFLDPWSCVHSDLNKNSVLTDCVKSLPDQQLEPIHIQPLLIGYKTLTLKSVFQSVRLMNHNLSLS